MIVMKFGGSSVKDGESIERVIGIIKGHLHLNPVVVVSAMGKTTRNLLQAGTLAASGQSAQALRQLDEIESYHLGEMAKLVPDFKQAPAYSHMTGYFSEMGDLVKGLSILKEFTPRSRDAMAAYGELLSSALLATGLGARGVDAHLLDARTLMITDDHFTAAEPLEEVAEERMRQALLPELELGRTPVIQGYIGSTQAGATTTLGFEGSDFTAAFVGAALGVSDIQIWKDVPGLMSTDPAVIAEAQNVPAATFEEMAELTYFGAKLLHPRAVWPAAQKRIPVHIYNSWQPQAEGTVIIDDVPAAHRAVRSIAFKRNMVLLQVVSNRQQPISEFTKGVLDILDRHRITPDLTAISSIHIRLALEESQPFERAITELHRLGTVSIEKGKASLCLVGRGLSCQAGVAAMALEAIADLPLDVISQGSSPNSLMLILNEDQLESALEKIHHRFFGK